jgi:hypothetical protein
MSEAVIQSAEITAGHDGSAELTLRLRYGNGALGDVVLDGDAGLKLMAACGASCLDELAGQPWTKIVEGL